MPRLRDGNNAPGAPPSYHLRVLRVSAFRKADTNPCMVYSFASTLARSPHSRNVADVTGPIEANTMPSSGAVPESFRKFRTVEELVKVIASGLRFSSRSKAWIFAADPRGNT